jgi:hypothetical protein
MPSTAAQFSTLKEEMQNPEPGLRTGSFLSCFSTNRLKKGNEFQKEKEFEVYIHNPSGTDPDLWFRIGANYINYIV